MKDKRHQIGKWGEETAAQYLIKKGYQITGKNYRVSAGEIDLIAEFKDASGPIMVFVEVKTRTSYRYGYPEEAITSKKWTNLMGAIDEYILQNHACDLDWRVDVIAIRPEPGSETPEIKHFENVIMAYEDN